MAPTEVGGQDAAVGAHAAFEDEHIEAEVEELACGDDAGKSRANDEDGGGRA